jgi:hypothetical protein
MDLNIDLNVDLKKPLSYVDLLILTNGEQYNENLEHIIRTTLYRESVAYAKRALKYKNYISKDGYITALGAIAIQKSIAMYKGIIDEFENLAKEGTGRSKALKKWYEAADSGSDICG